MSSHGHRSLTVVSALTDRLHFPRFAQTFLSSQRPNHRRPHPREHNQAGSSLEARNSDSKGDLLKIVVAGPDNIKIKAKREPAPHSDHWYDHHDYDRHHGVSIA